jgi:hypothetical protein
MTISSLMEHYSHLHVIWRAAGTRREAIISFKTGRYGGGVFVHHDITLHEMVAGTGFLRLPGGGIQRRRLRHIPGRFQVLSARLQYRHFLSENLEGNRVFGWILLLDDIIGIWGINRNSRPNYYHQQECWLAS